MVFPVVMYGCESWTMKKAEHLRIDAFELWCWRRLLRVPWTARRSNQPIPKEISPGCSLRGLMLKLKLQYFGHLMQKLTHLERPWCWERLKAGGEGDDRVWDSWMASPTQWTWVWVNSGSWTGRPGVLWFMELQRVGHDWATELTDSFSVLLYEGGRCDVVHSRRFLMAFRVSAEKLGDRLHHGSSLYITYCFALATFNIPSLSLIFTLLTTVCLGVFFFGLTTFGTVCASWTWVSISFPRLGKFSTLRSSSIFSASFSLSPPSGTPIMWMLVCLMLFQRFLKWSSILFILFVVVFSFSDFYYSVF